MTALIVVLVLVVLLALWGVTSYNRLIRLRNLVQEAWRQIDVELTRRHDLIPNLVETVKGYAAHERGTLEDVMKARSAAMSGGQTPGRPGPERERPDPGARPAVRRRRGLPRPQGQPELPRPAAGARRDRGPHRRRPPLLQRQRARAQHQGRVGPVQHRRRPGPTSAAPSTSRPRAPSARPRRSASVARRAAPARSGRGAAPRRPPRPVRRTPIRPAAPVDPPQGS